MKDEIISLYLSGKSSRDIGKILNICSSGVRKTIKKAGIKPHEVKKVNDIEISSLYPKYTMQQIADMYNINVSTVSRTLKKQKISVDNNIYIYDGNPLTKQFISSLDINTRSVISKELLKYIRNAGFPYPSYSREVLLDDFKKLKLFYSKIENNQIKSYGECGTKIFKHFCKNYYKVIGNGLPSFVDAFENDKSLKKVIDNRMGITYKEVFTMTPLMILQGMRNSYTAFASSIFKPTIAKTVYDEFCKPESIVLDISAGFGQRMLGANASKNIARYTGLDPWKEGIESLSSMRDFFGFDSELINVGSENFRRENYFDFCFSSPPFFDKEIYSNDSSQCYQRGYDEYLVWWNKTVKNVYDSLKPNSLFVLNMSPMYADDMLKNEYFDLEGEFFLQFTRKHKGKDSRDMFYVLRKRSALSTGL
jgi:DNA-binding CsgD family transcriptional regulator